MANAQSSRADESDTLALFITRLEKLDTIAQKSHIDGRSLQQQFLEAQQLYQTQLLPLMAASPAAAKFVSYQTEINRTLRLLGMDVAFLQSAKNSSTIQKRQAQMLKRLQTLLEFCRGLSAAMQEGE